MAVKFTPPEGFRAPMLCKTTMRETLDDPDAWDGYIAEPKHDGVRCLVTADQNGTVRLYSRNGQEFTAHVPDLVAELGTWLPKNSMVDGELAILNEAVEVMGHRVPVTDFNSTMRVLGSLAERGRAVQVEIGKTMSLVAYDLLLWDGIGYHHDYQIDRRGDLSQDFPESDHLVLNPQFTDPSKFGDLFDELISHGIEGIIVKNQTATYLLDGRPNKTWYKVKAAVTMDLIVSGYTEGAGKYEGLIGTVEFSRMDTDGNLVYVGRCSGMTDDLRRDITANKDTYLGQVIEVKSNELVGSKEYRSPRHPQFVAFRFDKNPEDCDGKELLQIKKGTS